MATYQDLLNEEKTLTQKLQEKRANYEQANQAFGERASSALKLGGQAINPADVFGQFSSFQRAGQEYVSPLEEQLATLRNQQYQQQQFGLQQQNLQLEAAKSGLKFNPQTGLLESQEGYIADPVAEVYKQNGGDLLTAKTAAEREAQAKTILNAGGVAKYRSQVPLDQLLTDKESENRQSALETMRVAADLADINDRVKGAGLGGLLPQWALSTEGRINRANIAELTATRMKQISGVAISDKEVQRLQQYLPSKWDSDATVRDKATRIYNALAIGLEMQDLAKKNGLTLDEAYKQFGTQVYAKYKEDLPDWINKVSTGTVKTSTGNAFTIEEEK